MWCLELLKNIQIVWKITCSRVDKHVMVVIDSPYISPLKSPAAAQRLVHHWNLYFGSMFQPRWIARGTCPQNLLSPLVFFGEILDLDPMNL